MDRKGSLGEWFWRADIFSWELNGGHEWWQAGRECGVWRKTQSESKSIMYEGKEKESAWIQWVIRRMANNKLEKQLWNRS